MPQCAAGKISAAGATFCYSVSFLPVCTFVRMHAYVHACLLFTTQVYGKNIIFIFASFVSTHDLAIKVCKCPIFMHICSHKSTCRHTRLEGARGFFLQKIFPRSSRYIRQCCDSFCALYVLCQKMFPRSSRSPCPKRLNNPVDIVDSDLGSTCKRLICMGWFAYAHTHTGVHVHTVSQQHVLVHEIPYT
jgi:hypothetical protein